MDARSPEEVPRIEPRELKEMIDRGEHVLVLDVRSATSYDASANRIEPSLRVPPGGLDEWGREGPRERPIVTY